MHEASSEWRDLLARDDTLWGTLDSWLVWHRTGGRAHRIDRTELQ